MTKDDAIAHARTAAEELSFLENEEVFARRFQFWPGRAFCRVTARTADAAGGSAVVIVDDTTAETRAFHLRTWAEYDTARLVIFPLLLLAVLACSATIVLRVIALFSSSFGSSGFIPLITAAVAG